MKLLFSLLFLSFFGNKPSDRGNISPNAGLFDSIPYRAFIVDLQSQKVALFARQGEVAKNSIPLMVTNGGMFDPDYSAHGILICAGRTYKKLDTRKAKGANFYMQPNGIFFLDGGRYGILPTKAFREYYYDLIYKHPEFATQSGPMLVVNDSINPTFDKRSEYYNFRSGVGILPNGNPIFIICKTGVTFYDFAAIFKDKFHCRNALFLDGGISEMFIGQKEEEQLKEYRFGPMIAVFKK